MPEEPDNAEPRQLQETGRFTLMVGLDDDGDQAMTFSWIGLNPYEVVGYLDTITESLKQGLAQRFNRS